MSNAPYLLAKARGGYRMGHDRMIDHMMLDGLEDAYEGGRSMGDFGEAAAQAYQFSRAEQDAYAVESLTRAQECDRGRRVRGARSRRWRSPVKGGDAAIDHDEHPLKVSPEKIPTLKPAFRADGTITAASSSANADGAAALILTRRSIAEREGLPILAEIKAHATHAQEPAWFTTAPIPAIRKVLAQGRLDGRRRRSVRDQRGFRRRRDGRAARPQNCAEKLNVHGGACALGHPIGATGARIIVTLLHAMQRRGVQRGVASLCIGGGEATAIAIERGH